MLHNLHRGKTNVPLGRDFFRQRLELNHGFQEAAEAQPWNSRHASSGGSFFYHGFRGWDCRIKPPQWRPAAPHQGRRERLRAVPGSARGTRFGGSRSVLTANSTSCFPEADRTARAWRIPVRQGMLNLCRGAIKRGQCAIKPGLRVRSKVDSLVLRRFSGAGA